MLQAKEMEKKIIIYKQIFISFIFYALQKCIQTPHIIKTHLQILSNFQLNMTQANKKKSISHLSFKGN